MTAARPLRTVRPSGAPDCPPPPVPRSRLIAVGVADAARDGAPLEWALADAVPGRDEVHVVHAYIPLHLEGCSWSPVCSARDRRHTAAGRVVAQAVQRARSARPGLEIAGSAIGGLPDDVLIELSGVVDLLAIGDDSHDPLVNRKITTRVQDHARCPIVCVPRDALPTPDQRPVTVVLDDRGLLEPVLAFGADLARRRGVSLQVSRAWSSLHEGRPAGPGWLAEQEQELATQLSDWQQEHPAVPVVARLELGCEWLERLRAVSSVLVTSVRAADLLRSPGKPGHSCAVAVVPESV